MTHHELDDALMSVLVRQRFNVSEEYSPLSDPILYELENEGFIRGGERRTFLTKKGSATAETISDLFAAIHAKAVARVGKVVDNAHMKQRNPQNMYVNDISVEGEYATLHELWDLAGSLVVQPLFRVAGEDDIALSYGMERVNLIPENKACFDLRVVFATLSDSEKREVVEQLAAFADLYAQAIKDGRRIVHGDLHFSLHEMLTNVLLQRDENGSIQIKVSDPGFVVVELEGTHVAFCSWYDVFLDYNTGLVHFDAPETIAEQDISKVRRAIDELGDA